MNYTYKNHSKAFIFSVMMFVFSACFRYTDPHVPSISANIDYGVPPFIAWVLLFVIAVVLMLLLSEEYQFTMSGITVNRLFFKKHYTWDELAFCGMLPKGVLIGGEPNKDKYICFSVETPITGKKIPKKCYYMDYSHELNEILRLLVPERYGKTLKKTNVSHLDYVPSSLGTISKKLKLFDVVAALPSIVAFFSCMLIPSRGILTVVLLISMGGFLVLNKYIEPQTEHLEKEYQYLIFERLKHEKENAGESIP